MRPPTNPGAWAPPPTGLRGVNDHQLGEQVTNLPEARDIAAGWLWCSIAGAPDDLVARILELAIEFRTGLSSMKENR
jgi:hypothetical protein